jgi:acetyl-CoA synthetase
VAGAPHSVVFAGFSADALASRVCDADSKVVLTADQGVRGGKKVPLKKTVDEAISKSPPGLVQTVLVYERTGAVGDAQAAPMVEGRDLHMQEEMSKERPVCPAETMDSEDTLFRLYTSGSTGSPKGMEHSSGGYLVYASMTHKHIFDMQPGDSYCCAADIGWITGHSYVVYGPLSNGHSTVLFESVPNYPSPSRYWEMVQVRDRRLLTVAPCRSLLTSRVRSSV